MIFSVPYLIEILTPKKAGQQQFREDMNRFANRFERVMAAGNGLSIPDNPMGKPRHSAVASIAECGLAVDPERLVMNLNTFHQKQELDQLLHTAGELGIRYLLVVRGDGGPALSKLDPKLIGGQKSVATSVDLIRYINRAHRGKFVTGAAFNQYNAFDYESDRLKRKIETGARFVITQPVIGRDPNIDALHDFGVPVVIEAWMSDKVDLLFKSVGIQDQDRAQDYDPVHNLETLHGIYRENCIYLSMLSFKVQWADILPRLPKT